MQLWTTCAGKTSSGKENGYELQLNLFSHFHKVIYSRKEKSFQLWNNLWSGAISLVSSPVAGTGGLLVEY